MSEKPADASPGEQSADDLMVRISSSEVFRGQRKIVIIHHGTEYRLHITKADKLILTK